jgi:predicted nucleic acid-binding protein
LQPLWQVQPTAALYEQAMQLQQGAALSFYDSLIVAAAQQAGCKRLITEDLQHGQRFAGLRVENPFRL